jgi:hypothetical protein
MSDLDKLKDRGWATEVDTPKWGEGFFDFLFSFRMFLILNGVGALIWWMGWV